MNRIIEVAKGSEAIISGPAVTCPCGEEYHSPFDKLYVSAYGKCVMCSTDEEVEARFGNIFAILT